MIRVGVDGLDEFLDALKRLDSPASRQRVMSSALKYAIVPVRAAMRSEIRKSAVYRNILNKTIGSKVKVKRRNRVGFAIAGSKSRGTDGRRDPRRYIHLSDLGTSPHGGPIPWVFFDDLTGQFRSFPNGQHPGATARNWRVRAARKSKRKLNKRFSQRFIEKYEQELVK